MRGPLADVTVTVSRPSAAPHAERHLPAHAVAGQEIQQVFGRIHGVSVEIEEHIADEDARRRRRASRRHADHEQRVLAPIGAALIFGQRHRLTCDAEVSTFQAAVFEHRGRGLPRDGRRDDDAETANRGGRRDADERA